MGRDSSAKSQSGSAMDRDSSARLQVKVNDNTRVSRLMKNVPRQGHQNVDMKNKKVSFINVQDTAQYQKTVALMDDDDIPEDLRQVMASEVKKQDA